MIGPRLQALINAGIARIEEQDYVATASDGVTVALGNVGFELDIEVYLEQHPTPDTW